MDHYQVKFEHQGKMVFGICENYHAKAKAAQERGELIVSDAVLPVEYLVAEKHVIDIPIQIGRYNWKTDEYVGADEYHEYVAAEYRKAKALSDSLSKGVQVGALFGIGVGDGIAWYVVTKVKKRTCRIEWRGFCPDRHYDHHFGGGGSFPIADVARYVNK